MHPPHPNPLPHGEREREAASPGSFSALPASGLLEREVALGLVALMGGGAGDAVLDDGHHRPKVGWRTGHAIAAARLGAVERGIRAREKLVDRVAGLRLANANAPGEREPPLAGVEWPGGQTPP